MEKYEKYNPDEETIEAWLKGFEIRLLCNNITAADRKRNWCQALVGEAGNSIIEKLPKQLHGQRLRQSCARSWVMVNPRKGPLRSSVDISPKVKAWGR